MKTLEITKKLTGPGLTKDQISVTEIPRMVYSYFFQKKISSEIKTETAGEIRLWCKLPKRIREQEVILIFTEEYEDDAVKTKFALSTEIPAEEEYRQFYDFEICATPTSQGWNYIEGNRFIEALSFKTKSVNLSSIDANHEIVDYIAEAIRKMRELLKNKEGEIVYREFADGANRPPR